MNRSFFIRTEMLDVLDYMTMEERGKFITDIRDYNKGINIDVTPALFPFISIMSKRKPSKVKREKFNGYERSIRAESRDFICKVESIKNKRRNNKKKSGKYRCIKIATC